MDKPYDIDTDGVYVYWGEETGAVKRVARSGGAVEVLANTAGFIVSIALDTTYVYYSDSINKNVSRVMKTGGIPSVLYNSLGSPWGIAVDNTEVFWSDPGFGTIEKGSKDGTGPKTELASGQNVPMPLCMDSGYVYWSNRGSPPDYLDGSLARVSKTGAEYLVLLSTIAYPRRNAVDNQYLYWGGVRGCDIGKLSKTGGGPTILAQDEHRKNSMAIDDSYAYWVETATTGSNKVKRVPLAGGTVEVMAIDQGNPNEIGIDDTYIYWTNYNNPGGDVLRRARK